MVSSLHPSLQSLSWYCASLSLPEEPPTPFWGWGSTCLLSSGLVWGREGRERLHLNTEWMPLTYLAWEEQSMLLARDWSRGALGSPVEKPVLLPSLQFHSVWTLCVCVSVFLMKGWMSSVPLPCTFFSFQPPHRMKQQEVMCKMQVLWSWPHQPLEL